jgi:hypothetical protein
MLARRMNLRLPTARQTEWWENLLRDELGLTMATESVRLAMLQDRLLLGSYRIDDQPFDQRQLPPIAPPALSIPELPEGVAVEPIALRVPAECLYVRFGSFSNFLWLQDTLDRWGGDLRNLVALRGLDYQTAERIQQQLVLKQTALSRLLGDTIVADVAMVGTDLFLHEGAAFGILFHARNTTALTTELAAQRLARKSRGDVTEEQIEILGKQVSYLSSPDGSVRSYFAADGEYVFATTSRTLMRRFLETGEGKRALGSSREFLYARTRMPADPEDTLFLYLSDAFFRNLVSPQYRIEMVRRLQAAADIDLVQLAILAAASEGRPGETIAALVRGRFLPLDFGPRPDGSRTVWREGKVYDSLRGHRGAMLPIPDVPLNHITAGEAAAYRNFAKLYREKWGRLDPLMVRVRRQPLPQNQERIVVDAQMSPMGGKLHQLLAGWAGPADQRQLAPVPGDMAAAELLLHNQRLFAGLRDVGLPVDAVGSQWALLRRPRDILVGYLGTVGEPGLLALLNNAITAPADPAGYATDSGGLWRRNYEQFTVFSLQREVLAEVVPQLRFEPSPRPAQLRIRVGDVSQSRVTPFLNHLAYARTRQTTLANVRLMLALAEQLHVPLDATQEAAELLLGARLVCPLGGQYELRRTDGGVDYLTSTALADAGGRSLAESTIPDGYQAPPLSWFRGLNLEAALIEKTLSIHAEATMQLPGK